MEYNPRVQIIPAKPKLMDKRVEIYARVSSNSTEQRSNIWADEIDCSESYLAAG